MKRFKLGFKVVNRWRQQSLEDWFILWFGTYFIKGSPFGHIVNIWEIDLTILNIGFKLIIKGQPPISDMCFHTGSRTPTKEGIQ